MLLDIGKFGFGRSFLLGGIWEFCCRTMRRLRGSATHWSVLKRRCRFCACGDCWRKRLLMRDSRCVSVLVILMILMFSFVIVFYVLTIRCYNKEHIHCSFCSWTAHPLSSQVDKIWPVFSRFCCNIDFSISHKSTFWQSVLPFSTQDAARYRDELKEISPHSLLKCSSDATTLVGTLLIFISSN